MLGMLMSSGAVLAQGAGAVVYRCPGPPVLYTDALSAAEARDRNCRSIEGTPITVIQGTKPRPVQSAPPTGSAPRSADTRVDPNDQRARDSDAKRILEAELRKEEERLDALKREYNNGEPERRGEERNYQRYIDRVAEMKTAVQRKEEDIAAIKRELSRLP
jgi:hypothetical protein